MTATHTTMDSPVGRLTLVAADGALRGVYFDRHRHQPASDTFGARTARGFERAIAQLREYFSGERTEFDLPLDPVGNDFQKRVWMLLRDIPYGQTRSYGELAADLGDPGLARAVGAANGRNPISVIVPCHRVIGADGRLVGYGGGLERKRYLLELERRGRPAPDRLF